MNIFFLDKDPRQAARYHCDKHVVKMILESAQMLCTTHNLLGDTTLLANGLSTYKTTHQNHPCTKWVRESIQNYNWLYNLTLALHDEWQLRYEHTRTHKSLPVIQALRAPRLPNIGLTPPALALPLDCVVYSPQDLIEGRVQSYRNYYRKHKHHILSYRNATPPSWL